MKKILAVFVLMVIICGGVFAEKPFTVAVDTVMDALYIRRYTGDYSTKTPAMAESLYKYQGDGDISSFKSSVFDDGLNGRVRFAYNGEKIGGLLEFRANTDTGVADNWYWGTWLRLGEHFRVLAGNEGQRGQIAPFQNFDDFLKIKVDYLGVMYPVYQKTPKYLVGNFVDTIAGFPWGHEGFDAGKGYVTFLSSDTNDILMPAGATKRDPLNIMLDAVFEPVTVTASVGSLFESLSRPFASPWIINQGGGGTTFNGYDLAYDPAVQTEMNFGVRAELAKIAEMINVAAVYKYADTSLTKKDAFNTYDIVEEKTGNHAFGVYTTVTPFAGLGITAGYSGLLQIWKNGVDSTIDANNIGRENAEGHILSEYREANLPFYSGIDLRAHYTGIEKLSITFNNNVSFANINGANADDRKYSKTWVYAGELNGSKTAISGIEDRRETYLGLYNALGVKYAITDSFTADVQVANQLGIFSLDWENDPAQTITDYLGIYAGVTYTVIENENIRGSIRGGLDMKLSSFSYQTAGKPDIHKAGYIDFGIPIGLKVEF